MFSIEEDQLQNCSMWETVKTQKLRYLNMDLKKATQSHDLRNVKNISEILS